MEKNAAPYHLGVRKCRESNPADTKISEKVGGVAPGSVAEVFLQLMEMPMVEQPVPLLPMVYHTEADLHAAAHGKIHSERRFQ